MQNSTANAMANKVIDELKVQHAEGITDCQIRDINENTNNKAFTVEFIAFEYLWIGINYEKGRLTPYIIEGNRIIRMKSMCGWWEDVNLSNWVKELTAEIKLRIPDKYLMAKY